jgi:mRNA interferase HigB
LCLQNTATKGFLLENFVIFEPVFNIINRRTLQFYIGKYSMAKTALELWYKELSNADYTNFNELKKDFASASLLGDDRVIFNIKGNQYRLVVRIVFVYHVVITILNKTKDTQKSSMFYIKS